MSIIEELMADQDPRTRCGLCAWLEALPKAEQTEWDQALSERIGPRFRFTHTSIKRALAKRNVAVGKSSVENHRTSGHRTA